MTKININIKLVFMERAVADIKIINLIKDVGTEVIITDCGSLEDEIKSTSMHRFNCCVLGGAEFTKLAAGTNIRTIEVTKEDICHMDVKTFVECGRLKPYEVCADGFIENNIDVKDTGHLESIFALGNGYLGLRGTYDELNEDINETPGMYINELFESEPVHHLAPFKGFSENEQYTVNLCDWRIFELYIDGEKASVTNGIKNHKRKLCFNSGEIKRSFIFTASSGKQASVESIRVVNNKRVHSAQIRFTVKALNFDGLVEVRSVVRENTDTNGKRFTKTTFRQTENGKTQFVTTTNRTKMSVATVIMHSVKADEYTAEDIIRDNETQYRVKIKLKKDVEATVEKFASFYSSADRVDNILQLAQKEAEKNICDGFDVIREEQRKFWAEHWENGDIIIKGNNADQQAVRLSLFHLKSQLPSINNASIGATGLTGPIYSGKVFWDTEMYLMPYYLFTNPESSKSLIMYRVKLLDKARERAKQLGAKGAIYSWCSIDGEETSIVFEASTAEVHINSDIAYAVWRYEKVTEDSDFVYTQCAEMIFETARYYAYRGTFSEAYDGRFCINAVCGPDEYACGVNNNCFTNFMVRFHFRYAVDIYNRMKKEAPKLLERITAKIRLDDTEPAIWTRAADKMYYHINEKYGVYEQDDHFIYNDAVDMKTIPKNFDIRPYYHPLDLWRMQVLKQADVVLLQFVFGDLFTDEEKKKNYDYYEPKTNHGSSLSAAIHAIMAAEIGYDEDAYEYFRSAAYMDMGDLKKNTYGGVHMACLGGVWMSVINGFMGMRLYEDGLCFAPKLPKEWESCSFCISYKGSRMRITSDNNRTRFTLVEGKKVEFKLYDKIICLNEVQKEAFV